MKLVVTQKSNKFIAFKKDDNKNVLYTIAKKGLLSSARMELYNKMGYHLYSLKSDLKGRRASFDIYCNEKIIMKANCTATFLNPNIAIKYYDVTYILRSSDRSKFIVIKDKEEVGKINVIENLKGDLEFDMDINDTAFDDFMIFFCYMIYMSFFNSKK